MAVRAILLIFLFFLGFSLFINIPVMVNGFLVADQSTYFAMAESIAHDGDLEYTRLDLVRYYRDIEAGPQGIFLKKTADGKIYFAKSWAYPLFAAPFVLLFGINGFLVFHSVMLLLILLMGFSYLSLNNAPIPSLLGILTFLFASVACVYYVWLTPDFFYIFMAFTIVFLWGYKIRTAARPSEETAPGETGRIKKFLLSDGSDYLAAFLAGIAVFAKPPNVVLMIPLVLGALARKKFKKAFLICLFFLASAAFLFGTSYLLTSEWNFMGGERKTFIGNFPFESAEAAFDNTGHPMTSEGYFDKMLIPAKFIFYNIFYYFFGRFTGLLWYFFPAVLFLYFFFRKRKKNFDQWTLFAALALEIMAYIVLMPTNYGGGGGSLANRYFLSIFPLFFFLPSFKIKRGNLAASWIMASVFISQILVTPFQSTANPAAHTMKFPVNVLPLEMTYYNEFPTNTSKWRFHVKFGKEPDMGEAYFLNDNFNQRSEPTGTWTWGDGTLDMLFKTKYPIDRIVVRLLNNPRPENKIRVTIDGKTQKAVLGPHERRTLEFPVGRGFKIESNYLHRIKIKAAKGSRPFLEGEPTKERRHLGVFFELELIPAKGNS
jgi:hypothetical protein